jgi:hypothetical protein
MKEAEMLNPLKSMFAGRPNGADTAVIRSDAAMLDDELRRSAEEREDEARRALARLERRRRDEAAALDRVTERLEAKGLRIDDAEALVLEAAERRRRVAGFDEDARRLRLAISAADLSFR